MSMSKAKRIAMRAKLFDRQGRKCCYCGRHVYLEQGRGSADATLEHLRRVADGGTDHPDNLALACKRCNSTRGSRSWVEFATLMSRGATA